MDLDKNDNGEKSVYQAAISGAEEILRKIGTVVPWDKRLLVKSDAFLEDKRYQKVLLDKIEFFVAEEELEETAENLQSLFQEQEEGREQVILYKNIRNGNPTRLFLEVREEPYKFPFEIHLIPFYGHEFFPVEKSGSKGDTREDFTYYMFPAEEYLALAFYEILKDLELIRDLSWYKEVYEMLCKQPADGRKVWEGLNRLLSQCPIPSLEGRLDTLVGYKEYGYMKKRWKSQSRRRKETYPQWESVISLMQRFLTPIFEGILKDEIFLGDWMPELGRYLD